MKHVFCILIFGICATIAAQDISLQGKIIDSTGQVVDGAHIHLDDRFTLTQPDGTYHFGNLKKDNYYLGVSYIGYSSIDTIVTITKDTRINFQLVPETSALQEVILTGNATTRSTTNKEVVTQDYIQKEYKGSLAKSLEKLPGFNAMEIGAGTSKPIIRGLGLNRVAVAENTIKQEGQQWGADHGLEIDALSVEDLEIIKGVAAIEYGSDAIGGVIKIDNEKAPKYDGLSGQVMVLTKTVNNTLGASVNINYKTDKFFYKLKATGTEYADYSLPTDTIAYLNFKMPVYDEKLKNTAGKEINWYAQAGYTVDKFKSVLSVSNVYQKSGFFPGSHGIPSVDRVRPDGDIRNIEYPFQRVNHLKVTNNSTFYFNDASLLFSLGYQKNNRQEWSLFHTHYSGQEPPAINPNLELDFDLQTYDAQAKFSNTFSEEHKTVLGIQTKWQDNAIEGFNFLLPRYTSKNIAAFATHEYRHNNKLMFSLGLRYDYSDISIARYYDENLYDYLIGNGESSSESETYAERSASVNRNFGNLNAMVGTRYDISSNLTINANVGTNFRLPTAIELGANGIHHGSFRHEQGNPDLNPERGWVADVKFAYQNKSFSASVNPYLYYFDNYIFLNPTGIFSILPHAGQLFQYTQSEAILTGAEFSIQKTFFSKLRIQTVAEYLHNQQVTKDKSRNYPLPFTPANNLFLETGYTFSSIGKHTKEVEVFVNSRIAGKQDRIAQGEQETPGYAIFGGGVSGKVVVGNFESIIRLSASNLFNKKYFNHTSFYRRLEIPEMGRNIQLSITVPFGKS